MKVFNNTTNTSASSEEKLNRNSSSSRSVHLCERIAELFKVFVSKILPKLAVISLVIFSVSLAVVYCSASTLVGAISLGYLMISSALAGVWLSRNVCRKTTNQDSSSKTASM